MSRWSWLFLLCFFPSIATAEELVIVAGQSRITAVPFRFREGMNSNPAVVQAVVDLKSRQITFFGKREGVATYTVFDARDKSHRLEVELKIVSAELAPLARAIDEDSAKTELARHPETVWIDKSAPTLLVADHATPRGLAIGRVVAKELSDIEGVSIRVVGADVKVEGEVEKPAELKRIDDLLGRIRELE